MPTININSVPNGSLVYITGIVEYSRIASHIDGEELAADNAKKVARGMRATDKPHTRLTINHCAIDYTNPAAPTIAERFIAERMYVSTVHPDNGQCYTASNKSRNLPSVYCRENIQSKSLEPVTTKGELSAGTSVTIMLRFFSTNQNSGVSLDSVIVNEKPVKWYSSRDRGAAAALAERGFVIADPVSGSPSVDEVREQLTQPVSPAPTAVPPVQSPSAVTPTAAAYTSPSPASAAPTAAASSLPIPPAGYMYDESGRLVPIGNTQGGIRL